MRMQVMDIDAPHYGNLNGEVACFNHVGCSAQGVIVNNPDVRSFDTGLTSWERLSAHDKFDFAKLVGSNVICESCRYGY